jgi:hypothetical protein
MSYAGDILMKEILDRQNRIVEQAKKEERHSDAALQAEIETYEAIWKKEDEFLGDGEDVDEDTKKVREQTLLDLRRNLTYSLVRIGSDREGVLNGMKAEGLLKEKSADVEPEPEAEPGADVGSEVLGSDEEWEYYSESEERKEGAAVKEEGE